MCLFLFLSDINVCWLYRGPGIKVAHIFLEIQQWAGTPGRETLCRMQFSPPFPSRKNPEQMLLRVTPWRTWGRPSTHGAGSFASFGCGLKTWIVKFYVKCGSLALPDLRYNLQASMGPSGPGWELTRAPRGAVRTLGREDTDRAKWVVFRKVFARLWDNATLYQGSDEELWQSWEETFSSLLHGTQIPWGASLERECCVFRCLMGSSALGILRGWARRAPGVEGNGQESWGVPNASSSFWVREGKERPGSENAWDCSAPRELGPVVAVHLYLYLSIHPSIICLLSIYPSSVIYLCIISIMSISSMLSWPHRL